MFSWSQGSMEATALCFTRMTFVFILLDAQVWSKNDDPFFRIITSRLQYFEYEDVSFHCAGLSDPSELRGIRNNEDFIHCETERISVMCTIISAYETDSGEYWCETKRGNESSRVNIIITDGSVILESPALPVTEGNDVTLRCRNNKNKTSTNLKAYFFKNGTVMKGSPTTEMTINNVSKSDEGLYKCRFPGVGTSPESWLVVTAAYKEKELVSRHFSFIFRPLWISVIVLMVVLVLLLLLSGCICFKNRRAFLHRSVSLKSQRAESCSGEISPTSEESVSEESDEYVLMYSLAKKQEEKDTADAVDLLTLPNSETDHSSEPQSEKDDDEFSHEPVYTNVTIESEFSRSARNLNLTAATDPDPDLIKEDVIYSPVQMVLNSRET